MKKFMSTVSVLALLSVPAVASQGSTDNPFAFLQQKTAGKQLQETLSKTNSLLNNAGVRHTLMGESLLAQVDDNLYKNNLRIQMQLEAHEQTQTQVEELEKLSITLETMVSKEENFTPTHNTSNKPETTDFNFLIKKNTIEDRFDTIQQEVAALLAKQSIQNLLLNESNLPALQEMLQKKSISLSFGVRVYQLGEDQIKALSDLKDNLEKMLQGNTQDHEPEKQYSYAPINIKQYKSSKGAREEQLTNIVQVLSVSNFTPLNPSSDYDNWVLGTGTVTGLNAQNQNTQAPLKLEHMILQTTLVKNHVHCVLEDLKKGQHRYYHQATKCTKITSQGLYRIPGEQTNFFVAPETISIASQKVQDLNVHHSNAANGCIHKPGTGIAAHTQPANCKTI